MTLSVLRPDPFTLLLVATVLLATVLPCQGDVATAFGLLTKFAIAALFFLHGAKLSRRDILAGAGHWRLHLAVLAATYILFPILGIALTLTPGSWVNPSISQGFLFLAVLPSTVQSSIAFTSIARGNIPGAVCAASASNLIGVFLTPLLVGLTMGIRGSHGSFGAVEAIVVQLLLPFAAGHLLRPLIGSWVDRHKPILGRVDRGSILLVVYTAFSAAVVEGIWRTLSVRDLVSIVVLALALLSLVLAITRTMARVLGFAVEDEIVLVFCGSKKSLASGVPMASVLFPTATVGVMIMPLMIFHQIQLMVCAVLARRYAQRRERHPTDTSPAPSLAAIHGSGDGT